MVEADDDTTIKIADFGFAKRAPKPFCLRTLCGTAQYVAPEVLDLQSGGYDWRADMWSVGIVIYILLGTCLKWLKKSFDGWMRESRLHTE
jgi:serine/threonine protein kinase